MTYMHNVALCDVGLSRSNGDGGDLLTTEEVAAVLKRHPTTVTRMVGRGELVPVRKIGGAFLFDRADIEARTAS